MDPAPVGITLFFEFEVKFSLAHLLNRYRRACLDPCHDHVSPSLPRHLYQFVHFLLVFFSFNFLSRFL